MMKALLVFLIVFSLSACEKESIDILEGTYKGTFQRDVINSDDDVANVTLILDNGVFKGSSDKSNYPAICQGTYSIKQDTIIFENQCMFTADFNWTLILDGKYVITESSKSLEFHRDSPLESSAFPYTDYFILKWKSSEVSE